MSFEGTYEQLQDFLLRVRNLARLVTINEVNYEPVEERRGGETTVSRDVEDLLTVEIVAEVYVQPAAGGDTTGGGAAPPPAPGGDAKDKGKAKDGGAAKGRAKGVGTAK